MVPILLLAAGASARMGGTDKLLLPVEGQPLLRRQVRMACAAGPDVRVTLPPAPHPRHAAIADLPVSVLTVPDPAQGLSASLRTAIASLSPEVSHAMLLLADLPALETQDLRAVAASVAAAPHAWVWRGATSDGRAGHPIIVHRTLFQDLAALTGDRGGNALFAAQPERVHLVPLPGDRARRDIDTPADWAAWRAAHPT